MFRILVGHVPVSVTPHAMVWMNSRVWSLLYLINDIFNSRMTLFWLGKPPYERWDKMASANYLWKNLKVIGFQIWRTKYKHEDKRILRVLPKHRCVEPDISNIWLNAITALSSPFWKSFSMKNMILFPEKTLDWRKEKMFKGFSL